MTNTPRQVLLAAVLSLATGCQPDDLTGAPAQPQTLTTQQAALATQGSWVRNVSPPFYSPETATVISTSEVLAIQGNVSAVYNPYSNTWRGETATPLARSYGGDPNGHSTTALPSGKLLIAGGHNANSGDYYNTWDNRAYLYDPATNAYTPTGKMSERRGHHTAVPLPSGKVLVLGGKISYGNSYFTGASEVYDPDTGTWSDAAYDLETRLRPTATLLYSGEVLVAGGYFDSSAASSTVTAYNPSTNSWRYVTSMPHGRWQHLAVRLYSGQVMVLGGTNGGDTSVDLFNPYSEQWTAGPAVPITGVYKTATMLYSGDILVTNDQGQAALYSPGGNTWTLTGAMQPLYYAGYLAVRLDAGQVLLLGGARKEAFNGEYEPIVYDTQRYLP